MNRVHLVIQGRVQGVGFRYFVLKRAQALGLTGWVENRDDGAVEVEAEGPRAALEKLEALVHTGPAHARVASVAVEWLDGPPLHPRFWIR